MLARLTPRNVGVALLLILGIVASASYVTTGATAATATDSRAVGEHVVFYSVADQEQFVNNEDDRARGEGNNPFGNFNDVSPVVKEKGNGPFAGDEAIFSFTLYQDVNLKTKAGTGVFTCQYDFKKQAFCNARYQLKGGALFAVGEVGFNGKVVKLNVTTGLGTYAGARGALALKPSAKNAERVDLSLT